MLPSTASPPTPLRPSQRRRVGLARRWLRAWGPLLGVLFVAAVLRLWVVGGGPDPFDVDEGYTGVDALRVLAGHPTLYFAANNGAEPLYVYLAALSTALLGPSALALRLPAALAGIACVLATYLLVRAVFASAGLALLTALLQAVSLWHLHLSRDASRVGLLPLLGTLAFFCLWRGIRGGEGELGGHPPPPPAGCGAEYCERQCPCTAGEDEGGLWLPAGGNPGALWGWFVGAGACFGLALYTYLPARLLPLVALVLLAQAALAWPGWLRARWPGLVALAVAGAVVVAPLAVYYASHWSAFLFRVDMVSLVNPWVNEGDPWGLLGRNLLGTVGMFGGRGDPDPQYDVAAQPVFPPALAVLFVLGLGLALWRARRPAYGLWVAWLAIMLLPGVLSASSPHFARQAGIMPAVYVFPALALWEGWRWARRMAACRPSPPILDAAGAFAGERLGDVGAGFMPARSRRGRSPGVADTGRLRRVRNSLAGPILGGKGGRLLGNAPNPPAAERSCTPADCLPARPTSGREGSGFALAIVLDRGARWRSALPFAMGLAMCAVVASAAAGTVAAYFGRPAAPGPSLLARLEALDAPAAASAAAPAGAAPPAGGAGGADEVYVAGSEETAEIGSYLSGLGPRPRFTQGFHSLLLPRDPARTTYLVEREWWWQTAEQLLWARYDLEPRPSPPGLERFRVLRLHERPLPPGAPPSAPWLPLPDVHWAVGARLVGYGLPPAARPGEVMGVTLRWRVEAPAPDDPGQDYTFAVGLADADGNEAAARDWLGHPTAAWRAGDEVVSWFDICLPPTLAPGDFHATVALYSRADFVRRPLLDAAGMPLGEQLTFGSMPVAGPPQDPPCVPRVHPALPPQ